MTDLIVLQDRPRNSTSPLAFVQAITDRPRWTQRSIRTRGKPGCEPPPASEQLPLLTPNRSRQFRAGATRHIDIAELIAFPPNSLLNLGRLPW
jgi:hypothetical protein